MALRPDPMGGANVKSILKILFLAAALALPASASAVEFRGSLMITEVTPAGLCNTAGYNVGDHMIARFRPAGLTDNGAGTRIALFQQTSGSLYALQNGKFVSTFKSVQGTGLGSTVTTFGSEIKVTTQSPSTPTNSTTFVSLIGQIRNPDGTAGCTITFRAALAKVP